MKLTQEQLSREVAATGFSADAIEKVFRLMRLLDAIGTHPFLQDRVVLKGGTALNLFHFNVPRLSVDIDLNYIGAADRAEMLLDRPLLDQAVQAVCQREGLRLKRMPSEHAGGKWRLGYMTAAGAPGTLSSISISCCALPCGRRAQPRARPLALNVLRPCSC